MGNLCAPNEERIKQREFSTANHNKTTYSKNNMLKVQNTFYQNNKRTEKDKLESALGVTYNASAEKSRRFAYNGENENDENNQGGVENVMQTVNMDKDED